MIDFAQLKVLKNVSFFSDLDDDQLSYLLQYIDKESFQKGGLIIRTGTEGDKVYFLVSGRVRVRKVLSMNLDYLGYKPMEITEDLGTFEPGYHFGEMALLGNYERSADVIAEGDCELFSIRKESFDRIIRENAVIGQKMLLAFCNTLASWIRTYDGKLIENAQHRALIEMLRTEKKKIAAMHKISRSTVFSTMSQVLDTILEACMDCLNVEKGSLMIFSDGYLRVDAAFGLDRFEITDKAQEIKQSSVSGRCFMSGQTLLMEDLSKAEGLKSSGDGTKYFNNSLLSAPLISLKGETIGVLNVNNKTSRGVFNEEDRKMLQDLAQEAAAILGYEKDRLKKGTKTTVLSSTKILSAETRSLPKDLMSLADYIGTTSEYKIVYEDFVRSTNDMAGELIKKGYSHGTVIIANGQSHGKGRLGRVWYSPPGLNIYMTMIVTPEVQDLADKIPLINLVASLSVARAVRQLVGLDVWTKWPNDIYNSGKKLGGILSESLITGSSLYGLLTGIGINVNQEVFPEDLKDISTSIFLETGKRYDRGKLIIEILKMFAHYYSLFLSNSKAIINEWIQVSKTINTRVKAVTERGELHGIAIGLNDQGMLMLELPDKKVVSLASAEIFHLSAE